ncbi:MAG: hypothetical protein JXA83_11085 [Acidimicrobiales bacterium]|nr:hypothetical protein [Acidimicrobiales bacterium]
MTKYLLSVYQPDGEPPPPAELEQIGKNIEVFHRELQDAGAWVFAGALHLAPSSTVLRPDDGEVLVTDGPYTEGKEHLGGLVIIEAPDLDVALDWGRKAALASTLPIEVRPFQDGR